LIWQKPFFRFTVGYDHGKPVLRKKLDRLKMLEFFIQLPPCLIGMKACCSAHYWARKLTAMGHTVKLMHHNSVSHT